MRYVALLRGINVGGNNKIDMKTLKMVFEKVGMEEVQTYINSGNVIFQSSKKSISLMEEILESAIIKEFGISVRVLVKSEDQMNHILAALPVEWKNDAEMKCDVMLLWEEIDDEKVIKQLPVRDGIDVVRYTKGAILWSVDRKNLKKSTMAKLVGTKLYSQMTVRNCNTTRKLGEMIKK